MESSTSKQDFICGICKEILYKPITTLCGHNYCMKCYENRRECPLCRTANICEKRNYNRLLDSTVQEKFPSQYKKRHEYFINMEEINTLKQKYLDSERRKLILDTIADFDKKTFYVCFTSVLKKLEKILCDDNYNNLRYEIYHAWIKCAGGRHVIGPYLLNRYTIPQKLEEWTDICSDEYIYIGILYRLDDPVHRNHKGTLKSQLICYEKHCGIDNSDLWMFDSNPDLYLDEFIKSNIQFLRNPDDHKIKRQRIRRTLN
jgi:hypothetical protein